ncbi:MAG TPA: Calx-beta domain-containing protein, partial [Kofleriaceae bacterium]|nr:Calx-beta domain-containing protein [Kofleriaceae bacterium]
MRSLAVFLIVLGACGFEHGAITEPDAFEIVPTVEFEDATSTADEASGIVQVAVVLSEDATDIVAVGYDVTGGNALRPDDFSLADGTVTFLPGQRRRTIDVTVKPDTLEESDEDIVITLSGPSGATIGTTNHHTLTISADILPRVSFGNTATTSGNEATDETIQAILTIAPTQQVTVQLSVAGTATTADHALTDGQTITFAAGETMKTVPLGVVQDALDEDDETVDLGLKNPSAKLLIAPTGTTHTRTITDDDSLPTVEYMATTSSTAESANATITVTLTPVSGRIVTVPYSVTGGTANVADATVVGAPGTVTFMPGQTSRTISVTVMQDTLDEADETVAITLGAPTNATLGTNTVHTLTITDDDNPPTVSLGAANASAAEGNTGTSTVNLTFTLSTASGLDVTIPYTVTGTATNSNTGDYTITASPVTIPAGMT